MDLTGINLAYDIGMSHVYEASNPADLPSPSIVKKNTESKYGQRTGEGWYSCKT